MITQSRVTVGTTAVQLASAGLTSKRVTIKRVQNNAALFIGTSAVTTANGFPFEGSEPLSFTLDAGDSLYAIADQALSDEVSVLTGTLLF